MDKLLEGNTESMASRVAVGLNKLGLALKSQAWAGAAERKLTPTQGQILALLRSRSGQPLRLAQVANELSIRPPTASDSVRVLVEKGLVQKAKSTDDARAVALELTAAGRREAEGVAAWPGFLLNAVDALSEREQEAFLVGLIKIISALSERNQVPVQRMCVSCEHFQANLDPDSDTPHWCSEHQTPVAVRSLRLDCAEHSVATPALRRHHLSVIQPSQQAPANAPARALGADVSTSLRTSSVLQQTPPVT